MNNRNPEQSPEGILSTDEQQVLPERQLVLAEAEAVLKEQYGLAT